MESNPRLQQLMDKYFIGSMSELEKTELLGYFNDPLFLNQLEDRMAYEFDQESGADEMDEISQNTLLRNVFQYQQDEAPVVASRKLWPRIAAAAAILIVLSTALLFYLNNVTKNTSDTINYVSDVPSGKQSATLTLANGEKIRLNDALDGKLAEQAGVIVLKTKNGQLIYRINGKAGKAMRNTLTTARGEQYQLVLPDGTKVWLNATSVLSYPSSFTNASKRSVELDGEAYFEVAKDTRHSFVVKSKTQQIEVLGTHFNVNTYDDESEVKTTLVEGSVKITANGVTNAIVLKPGQQAALSGNKLAVKEINGTAVVAWKNGEFMFDHETMEEIMRKVARWYDVEVEYQDLSIAKERFGGTVSRFGNVSEVLRMLELTGDVHFKIEGRRIVVTK
jgi:transmembrane sensor